MSILSCFSNKKPIIGVIHTKGSNNKDVFDRAKREVAIYQENGVDGILVEPYYGNYYNVVEVLEYLAKSSKTPYGVNCLNFDVMGFELANQFGCDFLQLDSVVGHVKPRDEATLEAFLQLYRSRTQAHVMGGVRFKYQPVLSENTIEEDIRIGSTRCDAVCVTQDQTGQETSLEKIQLFRETLGEYPLFVCAGLTAENVSEQFSYVDGAVVGSYFKDNYQDNGEVSVEHVCELMSKVKEIRSSL